jgi:hypothetical protein
MTGSFFRNAGIPVTVLFASVFRAEPIWSPPGRLLYAEDEEEEEEEEEE